MLRAAAPEAVSVAPSAEGPVGEAAQVTLAGLLPPSVLDAALAAVPKREREHCR
jgi:hypothetical protein